jgi:streptogramin lyase
MWFAPLVGVILAGRAGAQTVTMFPVPNASFGLTSIAAGPDGNLWYSSYGRIGRITTDGVATEFRLGSGTGVLNDLATGPDGNLWFTEAGVGKIGRITTDGTITEFLIPYPAHGIAAGPDGSLWFTGGQTGRIGRLTPAGAVTEFPLPESGSRGAYGIVAGPDGNLWFTEMGAVGHISTTGEIFEFPARAEYAIAVGADGNLWYTWISGVGRATPAGSIREFEVSGYDDLGSIAAGPDGNLWFTTDTNWIGRITPFGEFTQIPVSFAGGIPNDIVAGPDGNLWFTSNVASAVGRIQPLEEGSCIANVTTLCLSDGRFRVRTEWRAESRGTSGHGTAVPLTGDTGAFWFFGANSIEVIVKVLNGCLINGRSWVFAGGLTNVGVTLTVVDTQTGDTKTYENPAGTAFQPIQDTAAFPCP